MLGENTAVTFYKITQYVVFLIDNSEKCDTMKKTQERMIPLDNYTHTEMVNAALTAPERGEYIEKWLEAPLWGEWESGNIHPEARTKIIAYLGKVWDVCHMSVRDMYKQSGMPQAVLASFLGVPSRTMGDWCTGTRVPPPHVRLMMARLMQFLPSYMGVIHEINNIRQRLNEKNIAPQVQIRRRKVNNMNSIVQVKNNTIAEVVVSIQDLVYSGVQIDTEKIEEAGLDFDELPPLYLMAKIETDGNGNNSISYYYALQDYGNIRSAFGECLENSIYDSPQEAIVGWLPTIIDSYVDWEALAEDLYGPNECIDADEATKAAIWNIYNRTKNNCLFYEKEGQTQSLLNEIGALRGVAYCVEATGGPCCHDEDSMRMFSLRQNMVEQIQRPAPEKKSE